MANEPYAAQLIDKPARGLDLIVTGAVALPGPSALALKSIISQLRVSTYFR